MTVTEPTTSDSLPLAGLRQAVAACDAYEAAWRAGSQLAIETFVTDLPPPLRSDLLLRLVELELELRGDRGDRPTREEYVARFPGDEAIIRLAFTSRTGVPRDGKNGIKTMSIGDYELLERIGQGGMGVVYRALQKAAGRIVAIKMIRSELLEHLPPDSRNELTSRFVAEAKAAAALTHDHIVPLYEVGQDDGRHFFSMRYVEGGTLAGALAAGPLDGRRAAGILAPVARAVHHAHQHGILHRDLKPSNILMSSAGRPFVTDFGLAKRPDATHPATPSGAVIGTPAYLAPEVVIGRGDSRFTPAGDVYSLGATLYELLTGRPPFEATEPVALFRKIAEDDPLAPSVKVSGVERDLETICLKCLRKEPQARYPSAMELANDLERFLTNEPVIARRTGPIEWAWRWARRRWRRGAVVGLMLLAVALVVAIVAGVRPPGWEEWKYRREMAGDTEAVAAGREVELIRPSDATRFRWRAGQGEIRWPSPADAGSGEVTITSWEPCLLEFLPDPGCEDYELSVTMRQDESLNPASATAGVYVGHTPFETSEGSQHGFVHAVFADLGLRAEVTRDRNGQLCSRLEFGLVIFGSSRNHPYRLLSTTVPFDGITYQAPAPYTPPGPWRRLSMTVRGNKVSATYPWQEEKSVTLDTVEQSAARLHEMTLAKYPDLRTAPTPWRPRGGLGIILTGCKVSVNGFTVKPLPNDE